MKEVLQGGAANARKLATFTFIGFAVAFSFLAGCCIRWLVVLGVEQITEARTRWRGAAD
jgi:hypothetical protein